jgi:nucleoside-triphosphatase THEP1
MPTNIVILTGERGAGKTTASRSAATRAQAEGYACGGVVTLTRPGGKLDVLDVGSGETRRLTLPSDAEPAIVQGRFRFDPDVLNWGNAVLTRATPCQLLVVDELGPLELEREGGWTQAFDVLKGQDFALALVVVRPELVVKAQLRLPSSAATVLTVALEDRDDVPGIIVEMLERAVDTPPNA